MSKLWPTKLPGLKEGGEEAWGQGCKLAPLTAFLCLTPDWKYSSGFITKDMIKEHLPPWGVHAHPGVWPTTPDPDSCTNLKKLGYTKDMIFTY